ncbi:MAG: hypothetical protein IKQ93_08635 [Candidatus Methanomethylophilaceae archaeon]|nr:hypothetical protein [Candidatus Methanomethylophilaceae archaeon]
MIFYGWVPHLNPGLDVSVPDPLSYIDQSIDIFCDDTCGSGPMHLDIEVPSSFEYGSTPITIHASYGTVSMDVSMRISSKGMVSLEVADPGDIDAVYVRYLLREIYFEMKRRLHEDTHHPSDDRDGSDLNGPDELLTLNHGDKDESQAVLEIASSLFRSIQDMNVELSRLTALPTPDDQQKRDKLELMIHDQYRTASGFVSYAFNFINLFMHDSYVHENSLKSYQMSLDSLYTSHCNEDIHVLDATFVKTIGLMKKQNDESSEIAKRMNMYTLAMLAFTCVNVIVVICQALHVWG